MNYNIPFEDIKQNILKEVEKYKEDKKNPSLRYGQLIYNKTSNLYPMLLNESILGTDKDCFYQNSNISAFWDQLEKNLQAMQNSMKVSPCGTCFYSFYNRTSVKDAVISCLRGITLKESEKECFGYINYKETKTWV